MASSKRYALHTVAAVDRNMGISNSGEMPWPFIKTDVEFMHRITKETKTEVHAKQILEKQRFGEELAYMNDNHSILKNAVVFGRGTWKDVVRCDGKWDNRLNVVLTSKPDEIPPGADLVCSSLDEALSKMQSPPLCDQLENVYILGATRLYKEAMEHEQCGLLYITELDAEFPCDIFYPHIDPSIFKPVPSDDVPHGDYTENGVTYRFTVYKKQSQ